MGHGKLKMELMSKDKRSTTFTKRKESLLRKMNELTTLCDLEDSCMIIYGSEQDGFTEPEIWPQDPNEVKRIIDIYKANSKEIPDYYRNFSLANFYNVKKCKVEEELAKLHKKKLEAKYPIRLDGLNNQGSCENFQRVLKLKAEYVRELINHKKKMNMSQIGGFNVNNNQLAQAKNPMTTLTGNWHSLPLCSDIQISPPQQMQFVSNHPLTGGGDEEEYDKLSAWLDLI